MTNIDRPKELLRNHGVTLIAVSGPKTLTPESKDWSHRWSIKVTSQNRDSVIPFFNDQLGPSPWSGYYNTVKNGTYLFYPCREYTMPEDRTHSNGYPEISMSDFFRIKPVS